MPKARPYARAFLTPISSKFETFAKECIGFHATSAVRRDISSSHCDSCGFDSLPQPPRQAAEHAQSRNGVSQGQRPVLSRFAAARTAVACRELVGGSSCRQLSQAVVDISRVPRLTAIRLSETGTILQKLSEAIAISAPQNLTISPLCHNEIFQGSLIYQMFPTKSSRWCCRTG